MMASPLEVQLILCDAATADPAGKVHMLGAGWSVTTSPTAPSAIALLVKVPWDRANEQIGLSLTLLDDDGAPVLLPTVSGPEPLRITRVLEVARPIGIPPGSPIDASYTVGIQPLPLRPGRYEWRLETGDQSFRAAFYVAG